MFKRIALAVLAAAGMMCAAQAQPASVFNWSGFYVGVNGGYGERDSLWFYPSNNNGTSTNSASAPMFGGHFGLQHQYGAWVIGVEVNVSTAIDWTGRSCPNAALTCETKLEGIGTVGPRLGYANNNWLFYATGGYAIGQIKSRAVVNGAGVVVEPTQRGHDGYFVGAGIEYAASKNWILGFEYQRVELGREPHCGLNICLGNLLRYIDASNNIFRARLSWFHGLGR